MVMAGLSYVSFVVMAEPNIEASRLLALVSDERGTILMMFISAQSASRRVRTSFVVGFHFSGL